MQLPTPGSYVSKGIVFIANCSIHQEIPNLMLRKTKRHLIRNSFQMKVLLLKGRF